MSDDIPEEIDRGPTVSMPPKSKRSPKILFVVIAVIAGCILWIGAYMDALLPAIQGVLSLAAVFLGVEMSFSNPETDAQRAKYRLGFAAVCLVSLAVMVIEAKDEKNEKDEYRGLTTTNSILVKSNIALTEKLDRSEMDLSLIVNGVSVPKGPDLMAVHHRHLYGDCG